MVGEWQVVSMPDAPLHIIDGDRGKNYPKQSDFSDEGHCLFLNASNVTLQGFNFSQCQYITVEKDQALRKGKLERGDVVMTTRGTVGNVAYYSDSVPIGHIRINSGMVIFRADRNRLSPLFLYQVLRSNLFAAQVAALRTGSAQPQLPIRDIKQIRVPVPPILEQQAIACILGTLDDKIELNRRMNQTLEAMARAIFKSWFVDFDPVRAKAAGRQSAGLAPHIADLFPDSFEESDLGEIPKGWHTGGIGDFCDVALGGDWGDDQPFEGAVEVICLRGVDLEHLRQSGWADAPKRWTRRTSVAMRRLDEQDVLVAASGAGPLGRPLWAARQLESVLDLPVIYSNFCKRLRCKSVAAAVYVDRWLHTMRESGEIWEYATGTSIPNLDAKSLLRGKVIVVPPEPILERFLAVIRPVVSRLYSRESRTLAALRDTLLPKLISGELRVPDAERIVGRCA